MTMFKTASVWCGDSIVGMVIGDYESLRWEAALDACLEALPRTSEAYKVLEGSLVPEACRELTPGCVSAYLFRGEKETCVYETSGEDFGIIPASELARMEEEEEARKLAR